jgi:hypothetical protein
MEHWRDFWFIGCRRNPGSVGGFYEADLDHDLLVRSLQGRKRKYVEGSLLGLRQKEFKMSHYQPLFMTRLAALAGRVNG